jgi:glycosyltransferase
MKISADYDFILRLFSQPGLRSEYLPKCLVKMRVGGASNRSIRNIVTKMKEDYSAITRNKTGNIFTLIKKNTGKIHQFFVRD